MTTIWADRVLSIRHFRADPQAARYVRALTSHNEATAALLDILSQPESLGDMIGAERLDHPALSGIVCQIERDPAIRVVLEAGTEGYRFRQAVGVAVRMVMEQAGWMTTRVKGPVRGAEFFRRAERYRPPTREERRARLTATREAISQIGTDAEQRETCEALMMALASTRRDEGREF